MLHVFRGYRDIIRILGIDYGRVRVGLALSDPLGITAQPLDVISYKSIESLLDRLVEVIAEREVTLVVMGLPLRLDGTEGPAADEVRAFTAKLGERTGLPVEFWDERLTTAQAERALLAADMTRKQRKKRRDKVAAQIILQGYLDAHRSASE